MTLSQVETCNICGEDLTDVPCAHVERRSRIDIVFEKVVEHVYAEIKQCPTCEAMASRPEKSLDTRLFCRRDYP